MQQNRRTDIRLGCCINTVDIHILYCNSCILIYRGMPDEEAAGGRAAAYVVPLLTLADYENTGSHPSYPLVLSCSINRRCLRLIYRKDSFFLLLCPEAHRQKIMTELAPCVFSPVLDTAEQFFPPERERDKTPEVVNKSDRRV